MLFDQVLPAQDDPILSLMERYKTDKNPKKVNLGIGYYYDQHGTVPELMCIEEAKYRVKLKHRGVQLYLPMEGLKLFNEASKKLITGIDDLAVLNNIATIQSLGGSGALKIGADFLKTYYPESSVFVSNPTWENHISIFKGAGFDVQLYPYWDSKNSKIDFSNMKNYLNQLKQNSIILIQPCCHNPTGMDLSETQQDEIIQIIKKRKIIPFLDMAYHGFAQDIISDRIFVQKLLQQKISFLVANSYSKIFSLYGERIGTLSVVCQNSDIATQVFGQLKSIVRRSYSTPPAQGALLVAEVLNSQYLHTIWLEELKNMQKRMVNMREKLAQGLRQSNLRQDFSYITAQKGMFSYLKITPSEVKKLREVYGVYILESGRICIAGLNKQNLDYVIQSLTDVLSKS